MGTQRARGVRALAMMFAAVVAFFLVGGVAAAETVPPASDSGVVIDVGGDGAVSDGTAGGDVVTDGTATDSVSDDDGVVIELVPATSKEITPEEAAAAGQGDTPEGTATAGLSGSSDVLWIAAGVAVLLAGAFGLARIGKRAEG